MNEVLTGFISETETTTENVRRVFGSLNGAQLNWKPSAEKWSIGQCLEHLIVTNELEFPAIENALQKDYKNPFWGKVPFLPDLFGYLLIKMVEPGNNRKFKAPKMFRPSQSTVSETIVEDFAAHQTQVVRFFERSKGLDLKKTKIVSPISSMVTYSLYDSYYALVIHEQRHFAQAERVMQMPEFPR